MFVSEYFIYDGIESSYFDLYLVKLNTGMSEAPFGIKQNIIEYKARNSDIPYFAGVNKEPLEIELTFAKMSKWTNEDKQKIVNWLFQNEYKPLLTTDSTGVPSDVVYYCMPIGDAKRFYNGLDEGYITLKFRCDAPYGWSYPIAVQTHDLSTNTTSQIIIMENLSNVVKYYYPEIQIELKGTTTDIILKNLSDGGREFKFTGLQTGETIYVNNKRKQIITNVPNIYRYSNFNGNWLRLVPGQNYIEVYGECIITTRMQYPIAR